MPEWSNQNQQETCIAALATAAGTAGLAVIRISGAQACVVADRIFRRGSIPPAHFEQAPAPDRDEKPRFSLAQLAAYQAAFGYLIDPDSRRVLDQAVALRFKAPHSYTGEDVVELSVHGGRYIYEAVLKAVYAAGAVPAAPGEFTKRAFLNGKIDLSQAEAVMDLIQADAQKTAELALEQLSGRVAKLFHRFIDRLYALMSALEIGIEYPEYEDFHLKQERIPQELAALQEELEALLAALPRRNALQNGLRVALAGQPNVGKSSLLNALLGSERAIVTDIAGTTRDTLDARLDLAGIPLCLTDTAGLRESLDPIERLGVERAKKAIDEADYIIWTLSPEQLQAFDRAGLTDYLRDSLADIPPGAAFTFALNKTDLPGTEEWISLLKNELIPSLLPQATVRPFISLSAHSGEGLDELKDCILAVYEQLGGGKGGEEALISQRHAAIVRRALDILRQLREEATSLPDDIVSQSLLAAAETLAEVTGEKATDKLLDEIFTRFCVGK